MLMGGWQGEWKCGAGRDVSPEVEMTMVDSAVEESKDQIDRGEIKGRVRRA